MSLDTRVSIPRPRVTRAEEVFVHKRRLGTLVIDCETHDLDEAAGFWSKALGCEAFSRSTEPGDENYRGLEVDSSQPKMLIQRVGHPSRVHLDIETDDIDAEVARLERLGAKRVEKVRSFWVLEAPSGHRFCVVGPQRPDFEETANVWKEERTSGA